MTDIKGHYDPKFQPVADAFAHCFAEHGEIGSSVSATVEGEVVVDLWGGFADEDQSRPWEENTLCVIFSATKGMVTTAVHMLVERG